MGKSTFSSSRGKGGAEMAGINTAGGFLSLLDEDEAELHQYALQRLNEIVPEFWAEIAHSIDKM